jgi:hypothetical protein
MQNFNSLFPKKTKLEKFDIGNNLQVFELRTNPNAKRMVLYCQ